MLSLVAVVLAVAPLDVPGCKTSKEEVGSIHASTSYEVTMTTPKSKVKQLLECGGKAVTLYVSEFASPALAQEAANFTGPQLWGATAPVGEHTDELLLSGAIQIVASGPGVRVAAESLGKKGFKAWRGDTSTDVLERVSKGVDCKASSKDPLRAWCPAAMTTGAGFKQAKSDTVLLGISAPVPTSVDLREALLRATRVSALAFSSGKVRITDVTPDNKDEEKQLAEVAGEISMALKNLGPSVKISEGLAGFLPVLAQQCKKDGVAVKDSAKSAAKVELKNPTRLWLVKNGKTEAYLAVEDTADGAWLSVYPVVPASTK
jgi:hypothetical protein